MSDTPAGPPPAPAPVPGRLDDEQGNPSSARLYLAVALPFAALVVAADVILAWRGRPPLPNGLYTFLASIIGWLIVWASGPRIAQYVGPTLAGISAGIGAALQKIVGKAAP